MRVLVPKALIPKGQGTLLAPSPEPPSLWICLLTLGFGLLLQVLSKLGLSGKARLPSAWCCRIWVWGSDGSEAAVPWHRASLHCCHCSAFHRKLLSTLEGILASPPTQSAPLSLHFASVSSLSWAPGGGRDLEGLALMDFSSGVSARTMGSLFVLELGTAVSNYSSCWSADFKPEMLGGS